MTKREAPLQIGDPAVEDLGPAMLALEPRQRRFVLGYLGDPSDHSRCAEAAGYSTKSDGHRVAAHRMIRNPKIIAAIKEQADKTLNSNAFIAVSALADIAADPEHNGFDMLGCDGVELGARSQLTLDCGESFSVP